MPNVLYARFDRPNPAETVDVVLYTDSQCTQELRQLVGTYVSEAAGITACNPTEKFGVFIKATYEDEAAFFTAANFPDDGESLHIPHIYVSFAFVLQ